MKRNYKMGLLALTISSVLSGCGDDSVDTSTPAPSTYQAPIANNVALSGDALTGSTITGEYDYLDPNFIPRDEGASVYNWKVDNKDNDLTNDPSVGNMRTLLLSDANVNQHLYFCIKPVAKASSSDPDKTKEKITGEEQCSTAKQVSSANGTKPYATSVALKTTSGLTVGDLVEGTYDYADDDSDAESGSSFRWRANGNDITGAKSQTHTLTNQQEGKSVEFCVTPQSANPDSITNYPTIGDEVCTNVDTNVILPLLGDSPVSTVPTITGEHTVGKTLTAAYIFSDNDNDLEGTSTFSWKRDGAEVGTALTYDLVSSDVGTSITFTVTPIAKTGLPVNGTPVTSIAITDVATPVGPKPTVTLNPIAKSGHKYSKLGDTLTGSYNFTQSSTGSTDDSSAFWKADGKVVSGVTCSMSSSCDLTLSAEHYGKDLTYCVTPKAVDSASDTEMCSSAEKAYGVALSGTLEFGKTLELAVSGYTNPTIEWKVDTSNITGPTNDVNRTVINSIKIGDAAKSFLIGNEVFKKIVDADNSLDLDATIGNKNGVIDDADWAQASLNGDVTMDSGSADTNTINAAHYVGKDVEVTITFTEAGEAPVTLIASETPEVKGGVYYNKNDATKRGIEPVRELVFGTVVYHRPITVAEATLKANAGFGASVPVPRYSKPSAGIDWALYRGERASGDPDPSEYPAVDSCINLYDGAEKDVWHLPSSRSDGSYIDNGFAAQGNNPPLADADKPFTLIKLAGSINKNGLTPKTGLLGTYIDRTTPNPKLNYLISPTTGRLFNGDTGATPYWSATKSGSNINSVLFYEGGGSGNNSANNGRFVSCVRAK